MEATCLHSKNGGPWSLITIHPHWQLAMTASEPLRHVVLYLTFRGEVKLKMLPGRIHRHLSAGVLIARHR